MVSRQGRHLEAIRDRVQMLGIGRHHNQLEQEDKEATRERNKL